MSGSGGANGQAIVGSAEEAFRLLPGSEIIVGAESVALCVEYFIAPSHFRVTELAMHALLEMKPGATDAELAGLVREGILGATRRFVLGAQGLPVSGGPGGHLFSFPNPEEIKLKIVQRCRATFRHRR